MLRPVSKRIEVRSIEALTEDEACPLFLMFSETRFTGLIRFISGRVVKVYSANGSDFFYN